MSRMSHKEWSELTAAAERLKSLRVAGPWTHEVHGLPDTWIRVCQGARVAVVREAEDEVPDLAGGGYVDLGCASSAEANPPMMGRYPVLSRADADDVLVRLGLTLVDDA
jgi:hypothetical protein